MSEIAENRSRVVAIDLARFLALVSMYVAHVAPSPGPLGIFNLSEFLTAPLFVSLLAISTYYSAQKMSLPLLFASSVVRGVLLIVLGLYINGWGAQVDIILPSLGVLSILAVLLTFLPSWLLTIFALLTWYFTPDAQTYFYTLGLEKYGQIPYSSQLLEWLFAGEHYRAFTMVCWASLGIVCVRLMSNLGLVLEIAFFLVSSLATGFIFWHTRPTKSLVPYTGDHWEVSFDAFICLALLSFCFILNRILGDRARVLQPFLVMGRMTLSLYVLHIGILALYARYASAYGLPLTDDSWWMLALLFVLTFAFALLWQKFLGRTVLYRGPLETLLAWTTGRG